MFAHLNIAVFTLIFSWLALTPVIAAGDACKCLSSLSISEFTSQFGYGTNGDANIPAKILYDQAACSGINFHAKLKQLVGKNYQNVGNGQTGCLIGNNGGSDKASFVGPTTSQSGLVSYNNGTNSCAISGKELCAISNGVFAVEFSADGCDDTKNNAKFTQSPTFACFAPPTVSKSASLKRRLQAISEPAPPRNMRCQSGYQPCRSSARQWKCMPTDEIDSCGGCFGTSESVDCTELPHVSGVQCMNKKCLVTKCRRGFLLLDNACVKPSATTDNQQSTYLQTSINSQAKQNVTAGSSKTTR